MGGALTLTERRELADLERKVEAGLQTFVEVGSALAAIRDRKLYRDTHGTFEDYCQKRWGMERRRAYQLMGAAGVVADVNHGTHGEIPPPANERQARALASVPETERPKVWREAVETAPKDSEGRPKVTAKHVEGVAREQSAPGRVPSRRSYTSRMKELVRAATSAGGASVEELDAVPVNDMMLGNIREAADTLDRLLARHEPPAGSSARSSRVRPNSKANRDRFDGMMGAVGGLGMVLDQVVLPPLDQDRREASIEQIEDSIAGLRRLRARLMNVGSTEDGGDDGEA